MRRSARATPVGGFLQCIITIFQGMVVSREPPGTCALTGHVMLCRDTCSLAALIQTVLSLQSTKGTQILIASEVATLWCREGWALWRPALQGAPW